MAFNPYYGYTPQYGRNPYIQQPIATPQYQPQSTDYINQMQNAYQKPLGLHGKLISSIFQELIYGKLDKRSRLDCKSRRELGSTATCLHIDFNLKICYNKSVKNICFPQIFSSSKSYLYKILLFFLLYL